MNDIPIANIARITKTVGPDDTLARAQESLRLAGVSALPVILGGRIVGMISEAAILDALVSGSPVEAAERRVAEIMGADIACVHRSMSVSETAGLMSDHGLDMIPVVDEYAMCQGIVTRADVAGALTLTMRPPMIAGMATPLGVYLTTGHLRAGASDLGLFLTGVSMMLMNLGAMAIVNGLAWLMQRFLPSYPMLSLMNHPYWHAGYWQEIARHILTGASIPVFLLLLRLFPLSGYHGAEHQVVHTIENGEPLRPEYVRMMPRVHPRCGTNLVAGVMIFTLVAQSFSSEVALMLAIFLLIFAGRTIGGYFQQYVTTKPASDKQIQSAIRAGERLLDLYRENPAYRVSTWRSRIWNTGMLQVIAGVAVMTYLAQLLHLLPTGLF